MVASYAGISGTRSSRSLAYAIDPTPARTAVASPYGMKRKADPSPVTQSKIRDRVTG